MTGRWARAGFLALVGAGIWSVWDIASIAVLRGWMSALFAVTAAWFLLWRSAARRAQRLQARGDRALPCPKCQHYACEGEQCASCEGPCKPPARPRLTSVPTQHSYWLN